MSTNLFHCSCLGQQTSREAVLIRGELHTERWSLRGLKGASTTPPPPPRLWVATIGTPEKIAGVLWPSSCLNLQIYWQCIPSLEIKINTYVFVSRILVCLGEAAKKGYSLNGRAIFLAKRELISWTWSPPPYEWTCLLKLLFYFIIINPVSLVKTL